MSAVPPGSGQLQGNVIRGNMLGKRRCISLDLLLGPIDDQSFDLLHVEGRSEGLELLLRSDFCGDVLLNAQGEDGNHLFFHPLLGFHRRHLQVGGTFGEYLHEGVSFVLHLELDGFLDGLLGLHPLFGIEQGHPLDVDRPVQLGDELRHAEGQPEQLITPPRGGGGLLTQEAGGSHLAAGHPIDGVVDEDDGDREAHLCRMDGFREPD